MYDVYKIETIGDAYMVASGVPLPNIKHAKEIALMALDIKKAISCVAITNLPNEKLKLRIGMHTGNWSFFVLW